MAGPTWEERREVAGPNRKVADQRRGSKSLAQPQFPSGLASLFSSPSFSTSGRRHGQAGVGGVPPASSPISIHHSATHPSISATSSTTTPPNAAAPTAISLLPLLSNLLPQSCCCS
ncbi:hypothetical protein VPH35_077650 [Triticum aestivum]